MKKIKRLLPIILTTVMGITATCGALTACSGGSDADTQEASLIMGKAVEKIESVSEMIFGAIEASDMATETTETAYTMPQMRSSAQPMSIKTVPNDVYFNEVNPKETLVRQLYINYPYNIVDFMLQNTTKANKRYNHKYKVGQTVYGVATKTISDEINRIFENPSIDRPTLAVNVQKETDGISFTADWDWRNDILEANAPKYNSVIMTNAKVDYDHNTNEVDKITMTWYWTEQNGEFMASVMDFENNEFYFLEGWRSGVWNGISSAESLPDVFNRGELTYEKICDYPYTGIRAIKSNITSNINELQFTALNKGDSDLNETGSAVEDVNGAEAEFAEFYNEIYEKVRGLKMRDESDYMSLFGAKKVNFMNDAAIYGLNKTKCVTHKEGIEFLFVDYEDLQSVLSQLRKDPTINSKQEFLSFIDGVTGCLDGLKHTYIGELGVYEGKTYTLEYVFDGDKEVDGWRISCDKLAYQICDGETFVTFELKNGEPVNIIAERIKGLKFSPIDGGKAYKVEYDRQSGVKDIVIPETYGGLPVKEIEGAAFQNTEIESVSIPSNVELIGYYAFFDCPNLERVYYTGTVEDWIACRSGDQLFGEWEIFNREYDFYLNGELLTEVTVSSFALYRFKLCRSIEKVTIAENATDLRGGMFNSCPNIKEIYYNAVDGVYRDLSGDGSLFMEAGANTDGITVYIGEKVKTIPDRFFEGSAVKEIKFGENVELTTIGTCAFADCKKLTSVTIGENITKLNGAFYGCENLATVYYNARAIDEDEYGSTPFYGAGVACGLSIIFGASVESLPEFLFMNFTQLKGVTFAENSKLECIGSSVFYDCGSLTSIAIPDSVTSINGYAFASCRSLTDVTFGENSKLEHIGDSAFYNCSSLTRVAIPDNVASIGDCAFENCSNLISVTFGENSKLESIGEYSFAYCESLTDVTFGENSKLEYIGNLAFADCRNLTNIVIPNSVTSIGKGALYNCSGLTSVTMPDSLTSIGEGAFSYCGGLVSVVIPDNVKSIGDQAFAYCRNLTSITIPDGITSIGANAFYECSNLQYNVKNELKYLGNSNNPYLYLDGTENTDIMTVTIDSNCRIIGRSVFFGCGNLTNVVIPDGVTSIGNSVFQNCNNLTSVTIPDSLTNIGEWAFYNCSGLTSIKYCGTQEQWNVISKGDLWDYNTGSYTITYDSTGN